MKLQLKVQADLDNTDCYLKGLFEQLPEQLLASRSNNTVTKYQGYYKRFKQFMIKHDKPYLPCNGTYISLFIVHLLNSKSSFQVINSYVCAIRWMHNLCGHKDPTDNNHVKILLESSKRNNNGSHNKKDVLSADVIKDLCQKYSESTNLSVLRDLAMIVVSYTGFLRYDELSNLKCKNVIFYEDHVKLVIEKSKTDQYREGNEILLSKLYSVSCPVDILRRYIDISGSVMSSENYLFTSLYNYKGKLGLRSKNKKLSYTRTREVLLKRIRETAPSGLNLGLHSFRASGATAAANSGVNDRCWRRHGRWRSNAADRYVKDSVTNRLTVSKNLGL